MYIYKVRLLQKDGFVAKWKLVDKNIYQCDTSSSLLSKDICSFVFLALQPIVVVFSTAR
jgi:hypothetical protein